MNFAVLGGDPAVLPVLDAAARDRRHRLDCAALFAALGPDLAKIFPSCRLLTGWDTILTAANVEAVLVCGADERVLEAAKLLAAAGKRLVIFPRGDQGSTWIYELGLIRDEKRTALIPAFFDRLTPVFRRLRDPAGRHALGKLLYLKMDCEIHQDAPGPGPVLLPTNELEDQLLRDADLLRCLGGDYSRVTAVHAGTRGDRVAAATVTLLGDQLPEATWSARGTSGPSSRMLVIAADNGEITLAESCVGSTHSWFVESRSAPIPECETATAEDPEAVLVECLEPNTPQALGAAAWTDLVRAFEVVDAARASLRRRRSIDMRLETTSERNIFKSQMTAIGCLVMALTLAGVVFLLVVMPLFDVRNRNQLEAERAGAVFGPDDFTANAADLNAEGVRHLTKLAAHMPGEHFPVLIEQSSGPESRRLDEDRRKQVIGLLVRDGVADAADRTQVGPVVGRWYPAALKIVRLVIFAPLAVYLVLQILVVLAKPAAK